MGGAQPIAGGGGDAAARDRQRRALQQLDLGRMDRLPSLDDEGA